MLLPKNNSHRCHFVYLFFEIELFRNNYTATKSDILVKIKKNQNSCEMTKL